MNELPDRASRRKLKRTMARLARGLARPQALCAIIVLAVSLTQSWERSRVAANDHPKAATPTTARPSPYPNKPSHAQPISPLETDIVIARHVLLMDGEIVNWQQAISELRILRKSGPVRAHFHFTNGVIGSREKGAGWQAWHDRIMALYKDIFQPTGVSLGTLSPAASERYDFIRTEADLVPNATRARFGIVLTPNGKPAQRAQVIVMPPKSTRGIILDGTRLRDPFDEQWVSTNSAGRFTAYPKADDYRVVCLHPTGVAMHDGLGGIEDLVLHLEPWATIRFAPLNEALDESTNVAVTPKPTDRDPLHFEIFSIRSKGKLLEVKIPAGAVAISRSLQMSDGTGIGLNGMNLTIAAGAEVPFTVPPITDDDRAYARHLHDKFRPEFQRPQKSR